MDEPIVATLNIVKASIKTIETADLYLQLSQPADYILFSVTYNSNVFAFLPDSVQCALPLSKTDTSTPGVVSLKFESNALDATADVVRFSFRPLMAVTLSGFIVNNLSTNPKSTLKAPTVNVSVQRTEIFDSTVFPSKPDYPPVGMPLPVPPFALPPLPVPPPAPPVPPAGNGDTNNAVLGIGKPFIYTIQTADLYLQLDKPASSIQFNVTYDPNVFRFLPGSVQCALPWSSLDTSKPGIVGFKFMSQGDESVTATVVSFSFAPLMAVPRAGFIANGLVTNTGATLTVPTVNVSVERTEISGSRVLPLNPDIPPVGMPLPVPPLGGSPVPPTVPPAGNGDTNNAILGIAQPVIFTIQTADLYLQLDKPASSIEFNVTYDPNVFRFLPGSVQCALPWSSLDTSKPGIVGFKFMSQDDESVTATAVSFSFAPLMAVSRAGFIANGLVTDTKATLTVPTVNVTVQSTYIHYVPVNPLKPDIPPMGMPLPVPPFGLPPMLAPPMPGMPYYILPLYLR